MFCLGAEVNVVDNSQGITPLIDVCSTAAAKSSVKDGATHVQRSLDVIELLLRSGVDVHRKEKQEVKRQ